MDLFGSRFTFYSEKMPKLYTVTGGWLSIISLIVCIFIFIICHFDDMKRKYPLTITSTIPYGEDKLIKFGKEKIWIPWRIVDYNNNEFINHTGLLYPKITYYSRKKIDNSKHFNIAKKILNYKLCNETSMVNKDNIYTIKIPLDELFCIDMEDLDMGGNWISEFINYIQFDLYFCEDGIDYDESNDKCSSYNKIMNLIGENNSLEFDIYFPVVQFQPTNKTFPIIVIYRNHVNHISKYVNKIDKIFLQENILTDDSGWILKKEFNNSYWGLNSIYEDTYYNEKDSKIEGINSKGYSFNIYLEPGIIYHKRYYKKLYSILSEFFPAAYIIFLIMKNITKIFKNLQMNKIIVEFLFENILEKPNKSLQKIGSKLNTNIKINKVRKLSFNSLHNKKVNYKKSKFGLALYQQSSKINSHHYSLAIMKNNNDVNSINNLSPHRRSINSKKNVNSKFYEKHRKSMNNNNNNNTSNQNLIANDANIKENNNDNNNNNNEKSKNFLEFIPSSKSNMILIRQKLFPYRYYFFSFFIKSIDISKKKYIFSSRFAKIYSFLSLLFDIKTYLLLHKEFNILKKILGEKNVYLIEKEQKININSISFMHDINDCIEERKFFIFSEGIK
jgi:hypothetical protein